MRRLFKLLKSNLVVSLMATLGTKCFRLSDYIPMVADKDTLKNQLSVLYKADVHAVEDAVRCHGTGSVDKVCRVFQLFCKLCTSFCKLFAAFLQNKGFAKWLNTAAISTDKSRLFRAVLQQCISSPLPLPSPGVI